MKKLGFWLVAYVLVGLGFLSPIWHNESRFIALEGTIFYVCLVVDMFLHDLREYFACKWERESVR